MNSRSSHNLQLFLGLMLSLVFLAACSQPIGLSQPLESTPQIAPTQVQTATFTPFPTEEIKFAFAQDVPDTLRLVMTLPAGVQKVDDPSEANVVLGKLKDGDSDSPPISTWHYVIAAPFPRGSIEPDWPCDKMMATTGTLAAFSGRTASEFDCGAWEEVPADQMLQLAVKSANTYVLIPFEELSRDWQPRSDFGYKDGGAAVQFELSGDPEAVAALIKQDDFQIPVTNFDPEMLASVILTGTTALTRGTGKLMDEKGTLYPAEKIGDLLRSADITHISNEIAFDPGCTLEDGIKFCSKPQYLDLLKAISTDVIELTGNHELDYGIEPFLYSLDLYKKTGIPFYGGGENPVEAAQPLKMELNGNRIAFVGCNAVGPTEDLAMEDAPGSNPCDAGKIKATIEALRNEGYNPIVTFQHMEVCQPEPVGPQRGDFQRAADAGAVIVSGSQGHCPQVMEFYGDAVVHYGLGNLFFDQMDKIERMAFVDRYWFYDNRLIGVEPFPIIRDDAAQPRLMTVDEAQWFLQKYLPNLGGK